MAEILTFDQIKARYDAEWVLIGNPVTDEFLSVLRGEVLCHSKSRDEIYRKARELQAIFLLPHQLNVIGATPASLTRVKLCAGEGAQ